MATVGRVWEFVPDTGSIFAYLERLYLYYKANSIAAHKRVVVLFAVISRKHYDLIRGLVAPSISSRSP